MSEKNCDRVELDRLTKQLHESDATVRRLARKLEELAQFVVNVDQRVEELGESVTDLRSSNPEAREKASERSMDRLRRQAIEFRQERRASLLRP